ncbi:hypothetical protein KIN20_006804 [Parelaphostrongylus tenuis]|uniref:Uncharacterized protein n=1 Tax=Parelaphostrongylus tenuis TaxID=148309 RepID=A0AAD5QH76_PARTN|nr:hypothetical protein KIN20_006804 [Parelaphostrongylus tenuis]
MNMAKHSAGSLMILLMVTVTTVFGCGVMPAGQASRGAAEGFVSRLVMQTIFDVLERQDRRAVLPDAIISNILDKLIFNITYEPMSCQGVVLNPATDTVANMEHKCISLATRYREFALVQ